MARSRAGQERLDPEAKVASELCKEEKDNLLQFSGKLDERPQELEGSTRGIKIAEEFLRVRTCAGGVSPLVANAVQREFEERRGARNIVLKARQMGLTTWVAARFFLRTVTEPGTLTLQVAHSQEAAEEIFRIVHRFYQWLPKELREGRLKTSRANARQLVFPKLDSQYRVESAANRNAGRGMTVQNLHCSELARWPGDPAETLAGLRAALAPGAELVLESTPSGIGGCFYDEWRRAGETGLVRHFFPWWKEGRYTAEPVEEATYSDEERELVAREGLTPAQIGYRRQIRANFGKIARQEYAEDAESCFSMSGDCYFEAELIDHRLTQVAHAIDRRNNGELEIWLPPVPKREYIVAVDPAGGGSAGDYSAMEVIDMESGIQCAEFASHVAGVELARKAAELAELFNHAWLVVERNNHGCGVLAYLDSDCNYDRIYTQKGQPGWLTTAASRPSALAKLGSVMQQAPEKIQSARFLGECRSFVRLPTGGMAAQSGTHDDRVMAMAIAFAAREDILRESGQIR